MGRGVAGYLRSMLPIARWLPRYTLGKLRSDVIAGITVGLMVVPQGLAYATIAGLDHEVQAAMHIRHP